MRDTGCSRSLGLTTRLKSIMATRTRQDVHRQRVSYGLTRLMLSVTFSESSLILCWCSHHSFCMLIVTCVAWLVYWPCEARIWPPMVMALLRVLLQR
jgi:hypothetical protein